MMILEPIKACRICGSDKLTTIMSLNDQFIATFTPKNDEPPLLVEKFPLELVRCNKTKDSKSCGLIQLRHSIPSDYLYKRYFYRSGINKTMTKNLKEIVNQSISKISLNKGDIVLDIGCNDGTLLKNYQGIGVRAIGFDPAENMYQFSKESEAEIVIDYFNYNSFFKRFGEKKVKSITSIAMFYDLPDPNSFVYDIAKVLDKDGIWVLEFAYLPLMMDQNTFDTIVHEHLEYYHLQVLEYLFEKFNLKVIDASLNKVNGGSIRLFVKHKDNPIDNDSLKRIEKIRMLEKEMNLDTEEPYKKFYQRCKELKKKTVSFIEKELSEGKKIIAYGASTKGNTLLQFYGLNNKHFNFVADRNPDKWGRKTIGTDIEIISEEKAREMKPDYFFILPWHFLEEFIDREKDFLNNGGKFIVPLPEFRIVSK